MLGTAKDKWDWAYLQSFFIPLLKLTIANCNAVLIECIISEDKSRVCGHRKIVFLQVILFERKWSGNNLCRLFLFKKCVKYKTSFFCAKHISCVCPDVWEIGNAFLILGDQVQIVRNGRRSELSKVFNTGGRGISGLLGCASRRHFSNICRPHDLCRVYVDFFPRVSINS